MKLGAVEAAIRLAIRTTPKIPPTTYVHPSAVILGNLHFGDRTSVWPNAVIRADVSQITVGENSNVQDGAVIHCAGDWNGKGGFPTRIGKNVSIAHGAKVHGCTIDDNVLIGIGAIIMDGAEVHGDTLVGAGTLIPPGKIVTSGVWCGSPAKKTRDITKEDIKMIRDNALVYVELSKIYKELTAERAEANKNKTYSPTSSSHVRGSLDLG